MAWSYIKPYYFSRRLNSYAIELMFYAPILQCLIGFWMYGNRQIFGNSISPIMKVNDLHTNGHSISASFTEGAPNSSHLFLVLLVIVSLVTAFETKIRSFIMSTSVYSEL